MAIQKKHMIILQRKSAKHSTHMIFVHAKKHHDKYIYHREKGGTPGILPLRSNPICTLYNGYLFGMSPFKEVKQLGYHPKSTSIFI